MKKTNYSAFLLSFFYCVMLFLLWPFSSLLGQCSASDQLFNIECEDAPLICLQEWCTESSSFQYPGFTNFCGLNTIVNNPQYYAFIPLEENVEILIRVDYCDGIGEPLLQAALLGTCPWDVGDVIDCDPGTSPGDVIILHGYGLILGVQYYLLVDGYNGSICGYTIIQTYGIYGPEITGDLSMLTAIPDNVVHGSGLSLEVTSTLNYPHGYYWVFGWSGDTITSTHPDTVIEIPCDVPPGEYTICVRGFSGCDTTDTEVCAVVEVLAFEDVILDPSTFCPSEFPFEWLELTITGPGIYTQEIQHPSGCYYTVTWQIEMSPYFGNGLIDTAVCQNGFSYEGQFYDAPGIYELHYPGEGSNGCDSLGLLNLSMDELNFFVEATCIDSQFVLRPHVLEHFLLTDSIFYSWYDCTYDSLLSTSLTFTPDTAGCYCLVAEHGFCSDTICSTYQPEACSQTCSLVQERSCTGDSVLFTSGLELPAGTIYHWFIDRPGSAQQYYTGTDSLILDYSVSGCYGASLTIVTADSTFSCRDSVCVYTPSGSAALCCDQSLCDSCATITVDLTGPSPWTLYFSEGTNIDTILDVRTTPYSHTVCPSADSTFVYQLTVIDSASQCPIMTSGEDQVSISLTENPVYAIIQNNDTLCVDGLDMAGYNWTGCAFGKSFATTPCFIPLSSGCYCVEVTTQIGCTAINCYDFLISDLNPIHDFDIQISPIPSHGVFDISLPAKIQLPAHWSLVDSWGRAFENGSLGQQHSTISLRQTPPSGIYYLKILSASNQVMISKIVIEAH